MKIYPGIKVLITGAGSGIGRATAVALAERGAVLFLTDLNQKGLEETARLSSEKAGKVAKLKAFDISDLNSVRAFAEEIHSEFGPMEIVMNIAGIALFALIEDMTHDYWQKVINVNLWGPIHIIECFLPKMIQAKRGWLVNVASIAGLVGAPWHSAYSVSKHGLAGLSEVLRYDLRQHHIGVTLICPGGVNTPLKYTTEILGVDRNSPKVQGMVKRFEKAAIPPEKVAKQIISAIEKEKFLVITSFDVRFAYFCKKHLFPIYHLIMLKISQLLNNMHLPRAS